jgi:hypothetical protein
MAIPSAIGSRATAIHTHDLRVELLTRDHREFEPVVAVDTRVTVTGVGTLDGSRACASR